MSPEGQPTEEQRSYREVCSFLFIYCIHPELVNVLELNYIESPVSGEMLDMLSSNNNQTVYCNAVSSSYCIQIGTLMRFG